MTASSPAAPDPPASAVRPLADVLVAALVLLVVALAWGLAPGTHADFNGDSAIYPLASTQAWTPFYWGHARIGMLVPLLAIPLRDPTINYLAQVSVASLVTLLGLVGLHRILAPLGRGTALSLATLAVLAFGLALPGHHALLISNHGLGLALALAGRAALASPHPGWWVLGGLGMILGIYSNQGLGPFMAALAAFEVVAAGWRARRGARPAGRWRRPLRLGLVVVASYATVRILSARLDLTGTTNLGFLPVSGWPHGWASLAANAVADWGPLGSWAWALLGLATLVAYRAGGRPRRVLLGRLRRSLPLAAASLAYAAALGITTHIAENEFHSRYVLPGLLVAVAIATSALAGAGRARWGRASALRRWLGPRPGAPSLAAGAAALVALALNLGVPSISACEAAITRLHGDLARRVVDSRCTHLVANYWRAWPAVLLANTELYRAGSSRQVFGVAYRAAPTMMAWLGADPAGFRVGVSPPDLLDQEREDWRVVLDHLLAPQPAEVHGDLGVFLPDPQRRRLHRHLTVLGQPGPQDPEATLVRREAGRDTPGLLIQGPRWPLWPGDYDLQVRVQYHGVRDPGRAPAALDLRGVARPRREPLPPNQPGSSRNQVTIPLRALDPRAGGERFSLALAWDGSATLQVDRIRLIRVPGAGR